MTGHEREFASLLDLGSHLGKHSRSERLGLALHAARTLVGCEGAAVLSLSRRRFERLALGPDGPVPREVEPGSGAAARWMLHARGPLLVADLAGDPRFSADGCPGVDAGPALFVALRGDPPNTGYLSLYRRRGQPLFTPADTRLLTLVGAWTGMALENLRLAERVEKLAITDDLTQVYNYRFLKTSLRREIRRANRFGQELSLVMLDVDNLKAYNDRHGHLRGSFLLKRMAALLSQNLRSFDLIAKYGGDEFTLILPQTAREGALVVAERMRSAVEATQFPLAPRGAITISLGVATYPRDATDSLGLIRVADRALYRAKKSGRNRTQLVEGEAA
ncbi:MAG TPA: sensor domain-containing diguanylate cyclase [Candidatus Eisenbacteria bacterium]